MSRHVLTATDVSGRPFGQRVTPSEPSLADAAALGDLHEANYVIADRHGAVTLFARDAVGKWSTVAGDIDPGTAGELCLWFDLTHHYPDPLPVVVDQERHPLARALARLRDETRPIDAERAISLVTRRIRARGLDYPVHGLEAERFDTGWSVYAPVDVDESDPMAFLDLPVDSAVFLVSDLGRIKQTSTAIPPRDANAIFSAEEAFVRRGTVEEEYMEEFKDEVMRPGPGDLAGAGIASFTIVDTAPDDVMAAKASGLIDPIVQHLARLGPPDWKRFGAVFSFTAGGEIARTRFFCGPKSHVIAVPEQIGLLIRRQRHLAARMSAGPWYRLLLTVIIHDETNAQVTMNFDYGDRPVPREDLLTPEDYRNDLIAYPRSNVPAWLADYVR